MAGGEERKTAAALPRLMAIGALVGASVGLPTDRAAASAAPAEVKPVPYVGLSIAMKKSMNGLGMDPGSDGLGSATTLQRIRDQAKEFVAFRRGRMPGKKKLAWVAECFKKPADNIYCDFMVDKRRFRKEDPDPKPPTPEEQKPPPDVFTVGEALSRTNLDAFNGVKENSIHRALRLYPNWEPLQSLADKALGAKSCPSTALLTALAQKTEEYFPDPRFRRLAVDLYMRAQDCGEDESAQKARYRVSLLHIWDGNCTKAEPLLLKLSELKNGDNNSRSLYWRAFCARQMGNKLLAAVVRGRLLREFPLSYHGLLLSQAKAQELQHAARMLDIREPVVRFRSEAKPQLNSLVRGIEVLQEMRAQDLALELLDALEDKLEGSEGPFRLYVALLMSRSGNTISQFKALSSVFKEDPTVITRPSLELFYPLHRLEVLKSNGARVDPYLIAALIRQESGFNEHARSMVGAMGLMQLMPETARRIERVSRRELFDAKTNVRLGVKYFHRLLTRFDGDAELSLASYNAGPERVDEWRRRYVTSNRMLFFDLIPFKETRDYVALIARNYYWYLSLYQPGRDKASGTYSGKKLVFTLFN